MSHYDYGFRIYNPAIGKFLSVDPLTREYPMLTPYQFASNTPKQAIDVDGLEAGYVQYWNVTRDDKGRFFTKEITRPALQTTNGNWSGIKVTPYFHHNGVWYENQGEIPGWSEFSRNQQEKVNRQAKNVSLVVGGIVTIFTFIQTGGQSASVYLQMIAGFAITSGAYSVSSGVAKFSLELTDNPQIAAQVPNGVLNATVGVVLKSQFDDKVVIERIDALLSVTEGVATFNFKDLNAAKNVDNFMNLLNNKDAIKHSIDIIFKDETNNCENECKR